MTSRLNVALIHKLRRSLMLLAYFSFTCYQLMFVLPGTGRRPLDWCRILDGCTIYAVKIFSSCTSRLDACQRHVVLYLI